MAFVGKDAVDTVCEICSERVEWDGHWFHPHSGDAECWTGDGSTAIPKRVIKGSIAEERKEIVG